MVTHHCGRARVLLTCEFHRYLSKTKSPRYTGRPLYSAARMPSCIALPLGTAWCVQVLWDKRLPSDIFGKDSVNWVCFLYTFEKYFRVYKLPQKIVTAFFLKKERALPIFNSTSSSRNHHPMENDIFFNPLTSCDAKVSKRFANYAHSYLSFIFSIQKWPLTSDLFAN